MEAVTVTGPGLVGSLLSIIVSVIVSPWGGSFVEVLWVLGYDDGYDDGTLLDGL